MARKKTKTSGTATLTEKDRGTIQRLLKTGKPDNVRRAIDLTEAKCNQNQVKELYPDELIVSLASSGNLEVFAVTASFFLRHKKQWERFVQCVTDNKVLTKTVVQNRVASPSDFTSITAEAVALLLTHTPKKKCLALDGLTSLSDAAAQALCKHKGELSLNSLTGLSDAAAESLGTHQGVLILNSLTGLSDAAAESLGTHQGELILNGLASLTDAAAKSLAKHKGNLSLNSLTCLSDAVAASLGTHQGELSLNGLASLTDVAAKNLAKHKGDLHLESLSNLSDVAAGSFGKHNGELRLDGITSLTEVAACHLAKHRKSLSLVGLTDVTQKAAAAFRNKSGFITNKSMEAQISKASNSIVTDSASLTTAQRKNIKKLVTVEHVQTACELLKAAKAEEGDWLAAFPKTKLKKIVDSWDATTWNTLDADFKPFPKLHSMLEAAIKKRIDLSTSCQVPSLYTTYEDNLQKIYPASSKSMKSMINRVLKNHYLRKHIGLRKRR